ncbi:hypothetical protein [Cognatitamlana onchidii]|uniref:hypothetical protein n=1 Tax=Cognatitamlana onchidii TaxID=2562860 RepID=UPI0010A5B021|nr:hypothetical protein [Algibacter onchidii]
MKTKATLLIILLLNVFSCDEIDKLTEFDVNDSFAYTIIVSESTDSEGTPVSISESITINLTDNQDIDDNLDLIQSVAVNSITFEIDNFEGAELTTLSNVLLTFDSVTLRLADTDLKAADDSNTSYMVGTASDYDNIANLLKNNKSVTAQISGTISETPVSFDINIKVDIKVVIDVI